MPKCGCPSCSADPERARLWQQENLSCQNATDEPAASPAAGPLAGPLAGIGTNTTAIGTTGNFTNQDINGLLSGYSWSGLTVTYSFPTAAAQYGDPDSYWDPAPFNGFQVLTAAQQDAARFAFNLIAQYSQLRFVEMAETTTSHAQIRLAGSAYPATSYAYYPSSFPSTGGDVFLGNIRNTVPEKAGYAFNTILHEIGHAVGLKHGHENDGIHGALPADHDSTEWSLMSYHSYVGAGPYYSNAHGSGNQSYMINDIAALQHMYGANFATNAGNTRYSWSTTTGEMFIDGAGQGASVTNTIYQAIWDGNGTDTYDLANATTDLAVDLRPGEWSIFSTAQLADLGGGNLAHGNIANAHKYLNSDTRSLIENAIGGSGHDRLQGNEAANTLTGGAGDDTLIGALGNDTLAGGTGTDTAVFAGLWAGYQITLLADGSTRVAGADGTDTLAGIEALRFDDRTVDVATAVVPLPTLAIAAPTARLVEGNTGTAAAIFTVTRTGDLTAAASARYAVQGDATAADFQGRVLPGGIVAFTPGQASATITVQILGDTLVERDEAFTVTLANPVGATLGSSGATATIVNDDGLTRPQLAIAATTAAKAEGTGTATPFTFTVARIGTLTGTASATYSVSGAAQGADFAGGVLPRGTVAFADGQSSATITIAVAGDAIGEYDEAFTVALSNPIAATLAATASRASATILNDDPLPTLAIAAATTRLVEGNAGGTTLTFTVTRTGPLGNPSTVAYTAGGDVAGADFAGRVLPTGTLTFTAGQARATITLHVLGEQLIEGDEALTLTLSNARGATIATASATTTIANDDGLPPAELSVTADAASRPEGHAGTTPFVLTVTRTGTLIGPATAYWRAGGTALAADFAGGIRPRGTVAFADGQSVARITLNIAGDTTAEDDEAFTVTLAATNPATKVLTPVTNLLIADDDRIQASAGSDRLAGTASADIFLLGGGHDSVAGGTGADMFRFLPTALGPAATTATTITDFSAAAGDRIDLTRIDAIAATAPNDAFRFIGTTAFSGRAGELRWSEAGGGTRMFQGDTNGDRFADLTITLGDPATPSARWFML